jgi:ATP-binding cassette, subfamily B (MDR/TAP), member 1
MRKDKKKKKDGEDDSESEDANAPEEPTGPAVELKGTIHSGRHDINELEMKWWRSQIGLVQQEPFLFNESIYTNVGYGLIGSPFENESEEKKREMVREACKEAFADEFIARLPDVRIVFFYHTHYSRFY